MAKILITESIHAVGPELMQAAGHQLVFADRDQEVIRREIVDADAVIVRIVELPRALLETAKQLKIARRRALRSPLRRTPTACRWQSTPLPC